MDVNKTKKLLKIIQKNYYLYTKNGKKILIKKIVPKNKSKSNKSNKKTSKSNNLSEMLHGKIINLRELEIKFSSKTRTYKYESSITSYSWINNTYKYKVKINNRMYYFNKSQPSKKVTLYSLDYIKSKSKSKPKSKPSINTRPINTRPNNTRPNNTRPRTTNMSLFNVKRKPSNNRRGMFRFNSNMRVSAPIY